MNSMYFIIDEELLKLYERIFVSDRFDRIRNRNFFNILRCSNLKSYL